jgi:GntR family transcriptional regulator/MocR family aminotransferase
MAGPFCEEGRSVAERRAQGAAKAARQARRSGAAHLAALALDADSAMPLYRQLYFAIREAILAGRLPAGTRLPASRSLAADLGLSRNTVVSAYDQLHAEGYLDGRVGAGSYVNTVLPESFLYSDTAHRPAGGGVKPGSPPTLSARGAMLAGLREAGGTPPRAFSPGLPELASFPFEDWARLLARRWRSPPRSFLVGGDPSGYRPLREALARYLGAARAVTCDADQVLIVSGAQQAVDLTARALLEPGDTVWMEEPGFGGTRGALIAAGAALVPVPVDDEGLSVAAGRNLAPDARMAFVSPSHQYPLGVTMTLRRRLELLDWARSADAFVLEDDYDSEYRYAGRPLAAMQGLDEDGRILYVGSFSKVMFPGLRIGYVVVPKPLVDGFRSIRTLLDSHPSMIPQAALADFIDDGYLTAHIRRMRALYAERQAALLDAIPPGLLDLSPHESGMHLVGFLPDGCDDVALSRKAAEAGIVAPPLSAYYRGGAVRRGLLLGYAGVPEKEIRATAARLADVLAGVLGVEL